MQQKVIAAESTRIVFANLLTITILTSTIGLCELISITWHWQSMAKSWSAEYFGSTSIL